jgi:hypothetical protein
MHIPEERYTTVDVEGMNTAGRGIDQTDPFTPAILKGCVFH